MRALFAIRTAGLKRHRVLLLTICSLLLASVAAAETIGSVASLEGSADINRNGTVLAAVPGASVELHDILHTGRPGRLRLLFRDETVLSLADETELTLDENVFDPGTARFRALARLVRGKLRALVSERYRSPDASFEVETETAAVGVRGTEFVVVYDPVQEVTDVVGVHGEVMVHGIIDRAAHGVLLRANEITRVRRGAFPTPPQVLDSTRMQEYLQGLAFVGSGRGESLLVTQAWVSGTSLPAIDAASVVVRPPEVQQVVQPPQVVDQLLPITTPGDVINDSPPVIANEGKLGIEF